MNDLLWLVNHPLRGNVMGIPTNRNPDTLEGLESRLSVRIRRITIELLHWTELEPGNLRWTQTDSSRASTLELLRGLSTSREVLRPLEPHLSLSTPQDWTWEHYRGLNLTLFTLSAGGHHGIYRRSKAVLWPKIGHVGPTCQAGRPCNLLRQPSFLLAPHLGIGYLEHRIYWTHRQKGFRKCNNTWSAGQGDVVGRPHLGSVEPMLCATSFPHVILSVTMPYFGHNEDTHGFWSRWWFFIIRCSWNGRSTKLVELISNKHLSSMSWMKCRYGGGKYMHFMTTNTPLHTHTHTLRILLVPKQKKRIKS
jgi:hypothetical protein